MITSVIFCVTIVISLLNITESFPSHRSDKVSTLAPHDGEWGDWSEDIYCNYPYYAIGFQLKVEVPGGDDTAANSFRMICNDGRVVVADKEGEWGDWASVWCPSSNQNSYIVAVKSKFEEPGGDDTALNSVKARCSDSQNTEIETSNAGEWGDWSGWKQCGPRESVCGFKQRVEEPGGDDTALNAVHLYCCRNEKVFSKPRGFWRRVAGFGGGGSATVKSKIGVTKHAEDELTSEFKSSLTATTRAGLEFPGVGGISSELSATVSAGITTNSISSVSKTKSTEWSFACPSSDEAMYQWITEVDEDAMTETFTFEIASKDIWCMSDDSLVPKCPFGYCNSGANEDCQVCDSYTTVPIDKSWELQQTVGGGNLFEGGGEKWNECPTGYVLAGFWKNSCQKVHCIENMKCVAPQPGVSQTCYDYDIKISFDSQATVECDAGYFVRGIYSCNNPGFNHGIYCWEKLRCCKYDESKLIADSTTTTKDWLTCFDGISKQWCLVDQNEYITGFKRSGDPAGSQGLTGQLFLLEEAKVRKIHKVTGSSAKIAPLFMFNDDDDDDDDDDDNNNYYNGNPDTSISEKYDYFISSQTIVYVLGILTIFLLINIGYLCYSNYNKSSREYKVVSIDSETDELNV